jgi:cobalt-zinc-cadmium efflux system protein
MSAHHHQHHGHSHPHGHAHGHAHDPASATAKASRLLSIAVFLTAGFMLVEFVGGLLAGSLALLADAGHMLTDSAALVFAWAASRLAERPADTRRSFGYQRLRVLATFVNGCTLLFIVAMISLTALQRLFNPAPVAGNAMLWIGIAGLLVNLIVFGMLRQDHSHDMNVAAATLHVLSDLLGSVAAIVAALVIMWTGWMPIDALLSLLVCALIVRSAWTLIRRSAHILMEGSPEWLDVDELRTTLEQRVPAIRDVHHVHSWQVGPRDTLLTMHAAVTIDADHGHVLKVAKAVLAEKYGITHATIQIEAEECADADCVEAAEEKRAQG